MSTIFQEIIRPLKYYGPDTMKSIDEINGVLVRVLEENRQRLTTKLDIAYPNILTGIVAPTTVPAKVGNLFVDTVAGNVYISKGTATSADWVQVN